MKLLSLIKYTLKETYTALGFFGAIFGVVCIIDINTFIATIWGRIIFVLLIFGTSLLFGILKVKSTRGVDLTLSNDSKIKITFGDLFKQKDIIVIPVNRCFDTCADDKIISLKSVHGIFIKNVFGGNVSELENQISDSLRRQKLTPVDTNGEKQGNHDVYPYGTVAEVSKDGKIYYLIALTKMNKNNEASCDLESYYAVIIKLLNYIKTFSNGKTVSMPLIGSNFARLNKNKEFILDNLISILQMYDNHITSDIQIIIHKNDRNCINLYNYK